MGRDMIGTVERELTETERDKIKSSLGRADLTEAEALELINLCATPADDVVAMIARRLARA